MAAVCVSCRGDKSDKEESAGGFLSYGDCALRSPRSWNGAAAALVSWRIDRLVFMGRWRRLGARAGLHVFFSVDFMRPVAMIGRRLRKVGRFRLMDHAASSPGWRAGLRGLTAQEGLDDTHRAAAFRARLKLVVFVSAGS